MASYRPFPPPPPPSQPSSFAPAAAAAANQNPLPPPPYPQQNPYPPNPNYNRNPSNSSAHQGYSAPSHHYNPSRSQPNQHQHHQHNNQQHPHRPAHHHQQPLPPPPPPPQQQFPYAAPPPPPSSSYPPPPPPPQQPQQPPPMYYPSSQYSSQYQPQPPPPPPASPPPPSHSLPPPPPPPAPLAPLPPSKNQPMPPPSSAKPAPPPARHRDPAPPTKLSSLPPKPHRAPAPPPTASKPGIPRAETEEERRIRKKREYEKMKQDEKKKQMMKQTQATVLQKTHMIKQAQPHGSASGSRMGERRTTPFLGGDRVENRLKKPTTFVCKLKFRNELPDPTAQPKLLAMNTNKERYTKYTITSLEKMHKPKLYPEPDLGIPLDLLDLSVYKVPDVCPPLDPEDEELLREGEVATPVKQEGGIRRKERPTDKGVSWLVKTQYISSLSTDLRRQNFTEKQAKEMRESREGRNLNLDNLNSREKQIHAIEESFKAAKLPPVHQTKPHLKPEKIMPFLPDFVREEDQFVMVTFDGEPTADSEMYSKLDRSTRDEHEAQAVMKSFVVNGADPTKQEKFLAYMVPQPDEISKDMFDENEDISYSWIREYHWDVRFDDATDPTTYFVNFDDDVAQYLPLPTRLVLQKKRAKEGRSSDEIEHYPVPSRVTVRRRDAVAVLEPKESGGMSSSHANSKRGRYLREDDEEPQHKLPRMDDMDQYSGEEEMSE